MSRGQLHLTRRWMLSFLLVFTAVMFMGSFCAYARGPQKSGKYLVNDDGTQTPLSDREYRQLKENGSLFSEIDDTDAVDSSDALSARPDYNGVFEVYHNYFNYYPYSMTGNSEWDGYYTGRKLFMEYRAKKDKKWKLSGYMQRNLIKLAVDQGYSISGLKPNTTYYTRIRYLNDDGSLGPYRNTTTIKTGKSKAPALKSVTVKGYSVKYRKVRHYLYGVYMYTEKFYTYKVKVTVKLKKRPGTKGIFLRVSDGVWDTGDVWIKGNKKKYTKKFTPYPNYSQKNPRHRKKFVVSVRSGQDKKWYGKSPAKSKTKKMS